jgi:hypothetical protein
VSLCNAPANPRAEARPLRTMQRALRDLPAASAGRSEARFVTALAHRVPGVVLHRGRTDQIYFAVAGLLFSSTTINSNGLSPAFSGKCSPPESHLIIPAFQSTFWLFPSGCVNFP